MTSTKLTYDDSTSNVLCSLARGVLTTKFSHNTIWKRTLNLFRCTGNCRFSTRKKRSKHQAFRDAVGIRQKSVCPSLGYRRLRRPQVVRGHGWGRESGQRISTGHLLAPSESVMPSWQRYSNRRVERAPCWIQRPERCPGWAGRAEQKHSSVDAAILPDITPGALPCPGDWLLT